MRKLLIVFLVILLSVLLVGVRLTILHVNDTHGHAWAFDEYRNPGIGGLAAIATIVEEVKREVESQGGYVIFLHAGDINTGVPESDLQDAIPDIVGFNMIGLAAMAVGNHEFDNPREVLLKQMKFADFPFLSANIVKEDGEPFFTPYVVEDLGGLKVAVIGFTTEETTILEPLYLEGLKFENALKIAQKLAPELKEQANVVVALAHLDWGEEAKEGVTTTHQLARVEGIDVVIAGHSHYLGSEVVDGKIVASAGDYGKYVGRLDLDIENGKIVAWHWEAIPVNLKVYENGKYRYVGKPYLENRYVAKALEYFKKIGNEKLDTVIGETKILLDGEREHVRSRSTNLTNLITDAMRWRVGADIALTNGGGIRASIRPGKITVRDILTVLPFGNTLYVLNLTGEQIMKVLEYAATVPEGKGAFLQVSGLTWRSKDGKVVEVLVNGEPLDPKKVYKVVTNNYMAGGGDGYTMLKEWGGYDTGFLMSDAVIEYIQKVLNGVVEEYDSSQRYTRE
ncbi:bifunctional UDP-sugar hydrolase/5'-nucleotidase [Thermotoga sp. KOL6]|uniref:bifunctional UDP-sugar hydrolase/5'-nucleotidase n=1 Tax=Thermotoga sp. KOL6 TaxID=126741 RepID=UPI000C76E9E2|nr:bifunctional UDP-sugar hydrolase/5'-nucleotidase [Thermotoga sp. KOL6]PLV60395.1 bifunctional metallophosphatase/5'-nucleotidase [Thermotoga sp. KOL6]